MNHYIKILAVCFTAILLAGCLNDPEMKREETTPTPEPTDNPSNMPVMGTHEEFSVSVPEISGLCLKSDKSGMWAVGDKGGLYSLDFEGRSEAVLTQDLDMEAVTTDPATGDVYIAVERVQKVYKATAPNYDSFTELFTVQEAVDKKFDNDGLEGISWYKDNSLFVGAQGEASLWLIGTDGTVKSSRSLKNAASWIGEIAALCYDSAADWLWVTDSKAKKLGIFSPDGTTLLATYSLSFIDNAESVCVDRERNCVWVGSDEKNPKLYKINFSFKAE